MSKEKSSAKSKTEAKKVSESKKSSSASPASKKPVQKVIKKVPAKASPSKEDSPLDKYLKAGEIALKLKSMILEKVKVGASVLEICEFGETKILELGGKLAFPLNVSINNIAAHYSSPPEDNLVIQHGDIVKVDWGVHVDGYVADTAYTISFNPDHKDLIKASEEATKAAIDLIRPGIVSERIGEEIESIIRKYGFRPIKELSGHQLEQNILHGPTIIPNIKGIKGVKLQEGQAFAIETFASTGTGNIHSDESRCFIYQLLPIQRPLRLESSKKARKIILAKYKDFPFTIRWLAKELTPQITKLALKDLTNNGQIRQFPALCDERGSFISQSEHTVYLTENSRIVTTLPKQ